MIRTVIIATTATATLVPSFSAAIFVWPAISAEHTTVAPDLSGTWAREYLFFGSPDTGPGPIRTKVPGQDVGDDSNPMLKPGAAAIVKQRGEVTLSGRNFPQPSNQCAPMSVPYILLGQEIQLLQKPDEVVILYMQEGTPCETEQPACGVHNPELVGRFRRPLRRRHAGGRYDWFQDRAFIHGR